MPSCHSCLVIIDQGAQVCPFCGADQSIPIEAAPLDSPQESAPTASLRESAIFIVVGLAAIVCLAGILWFNFGGYTLSPGLEAAETAAKSLRDVREALSTYALFAKDTYPAGLDSFGDRLSRATQTASSAGYTLIYTPRSAAGDGIFLGFVLLARPEKSSYLNLYIDESGVVRATTENRPASSFDPPL
jgi:hypothetical protein